MMVSRQNAVKPKAAAAAVRATTFIVGFLLAAGIALRLRMYLTAGLFWLDEAMLVESIYSRSLPELMLRPLEWNQTSPPGFLMLEWLALKTIGPSEAALRLVPLLGSVAALVLFVPLAFRCFASDAWPAVLAIGLFALAPHLSEYAGELKPYALDALAAILVTLATLRALQAGLPPPWTRRLALLGAVVVWFSQPAVFVLAGIGTAALVWRIRAHEPVRPALGVAAVWAPFVMASVLWSVVVLGSAGRVVMDDHWSASFLPLLPRTAADLWRHAEALLSLFRQPLVTGLPVLGLLLFAAGAYALRRTPVGWVLLAPLPAVWLAASVGRYPWGSLLGGPRDSRVLLFLLPALCILVAAGVGHVATFRVRYARAGAVALACLLAGQSALAAWRGLPPPPRLGEILDILADHIEPGDSVFVFILAVPEYQLYASTYGLDDFPWTESQWYGTDPRAYAADLARLPPGRHWIVLQLTEDLGGPEEIARVADRYGRRLAAFHDGGASLYLYDVPPH